MPAIMASQPTPRSRHSSGFPDKLVIAISSRALFDLDASRRVFVEEAVDAYCQYQIEHEDDVLKPGIAFPLVQNLLALNDAEPGASTRTAWPRSEPSFGDARPPDSRRSNSPKPKSCGQSMAATN